MKLNIALMVFFAFVFAQAQNQDLNGNSAVFVELSRVNGLTVDNEKGQILIETSNLELRKSGLVNYLTTGGLCLGMSAAISVGYDIHFSEGDAIRTAAKKFLDINGGEGSMYVCISNSGVGIVDLGEKLHYFGARAGVTGAYSILLAVGFDPNSNNRNMILTYNDRIQRRKINLYGLQASVGLSKMPNASAMCGLVSENNGLLCQLQLGTGIGYGLTIGYKREIDL